MSVRFAGRSYPESTQSITVRDHVVDDLSPLAALPKLTKLELYGVRNPTLRGIEALRLQRLTATDVTGLGALAGMDSLRELNVSGAVTDLTPLADLRALEALDLLHTRAADLAPLAGHTALRTLMVAATDVKDLGPLAGIPLRELNVTGTDVADLSPLEVSGLVDLNLCRTAVTDLQPLATAAKLEVLAFDDTGVASLEPLRSAGRLRWLRLARTAVADLAPLSGLDSLRSLDVENTRVMTLAPLARLRLEELTANGIPAKDFERVGYAPGATVWAGATVEDLGAALARWPEVRFLGHWRLSAERPGVRVHLVAQGRVLELDGEQTRYLVERMGFDAGRAPDLSHWHARLLRRSGGTEPPDAGDAAYWGRLVRVAADALAAAPGLGRHKLVKPGRWPVSAEDAERCAKSLEAHRNDGSTPADLVFLGTLRDWMRASGGFETWVFQE